jgi:mono/diheme cytochrome c family protein/polyisoprenoid-binding protein YceI
MILLIFSILLMSAFAAGAAAAKPRNFKLVSGEVRFEIDAPLDDITGVSRGLGGAVVVDPEALSEGASGRIVIDLTSFRTGIDLRDEDLRVQFFESIRFPAAELTLQRLVSEQAGLNPGTSMPVVIKAALSLHGVSQDVEIPVQARYDESASGARVQVNGAVVVSLEKFGMKRPRRLLFKLGKDVRVNLIATFRAPPLTTPNAEPTLTAVDALPPTAPVVVARAPVKPKPPLWRFAATTPEGRGERLAANKTIGGDKNQVSCRSCHGIHDERRGLYVAGAVKPASSLWGSARRPTLWQGFASTPGAAASLCAKLFMLRPQGLDAAHEADLAAYLKALSPDRAPAHNYTALHQSRAELPAALDDVRAGNKARGKKLVEVYCVSCHAKGAMRPALEPGLYERHMIGERVRRVTGADNNQMPPIPLDRLSDSELVDMAAFLGDEKQRIFVR